MPLDLAAEPGGVIPHWI